MHKADSDCKCFVTILPPTITQNIETTQVKGPDTKLTRTERQFYEQCTLNKKMHTPHNQFYHDQHVHSTTQCIDACWCLKKDNLKSCQLAISSIVELHHLQTQVDANLAMIKLLLLRFANDLSTKAHVQCLPLTPLRQHPIVHPAEVPVCQVFW